MKPPPARRALATMALLALIVAVGCREEATATFSVSLHNASTQPITAWLTKTGGPAEADWLAPEDVSLSRAAATDRYNGVIVPPGKTADLGPIVGKFYHDSLAVLRVYAGSLGLDGVLATGVDSSLRVDVPLREGANKLIVRPTSKFTVEQDER